MTDSNFLWWRDGIIYQIYPRSFADSNGDGIGDLNGITARLDYLAELGVDALWLSPISPSPDVDFGYDVSDYVDIDPKFGTLADFDRLLAEAHRRSIHIVLDLVLNHTSDQHPWFQESRQSRAAAKRDWYIWRDPAPGGGKPNNWQSVFGGSAWQWDPHTRQYYLHLFYKEQPDLNWRNPEVRQAMLDVFRFWLDRGVDGFRLDVFNMYFKDAGFRSNPPKPGLRGFDRQQHIYDHSQPEMFPLLAEIRAILDAYPERYAVGETFMGSPEHAAEYVGPDKLHAAFEFDLLHCCWNPADYHRVIARSQAAFGPETWPTVVLNNHDNVRSGTRLAPMESDVRLKVAAALLLTLRGTPFMYYGEEIGQRDIRITRELIQDPVGKRFWPFYVGRDGCRAPMQWDETPQAGFTTGTPWLPVHPDYIFRSVTSQKADPESLWHFYRRLIQLRRSSPALRGGMFQWLTFQPRKLLAYLRQTAAETALVALNFSPVKLSLTLSKELVGRNWRMGLSTHHGTVPLITDGWLPLEPYEALILIES
ncbi:MAG: alpha-glucosidase C-terminal domain-containing protein [Longilinea sp.]|nr:alpha-glucosidase C-terminal domain-containing protein [Longilinea sp.]